MLQDIVHLQLLDLHPALCICQADAFSGVNFHCSQNLQARSQPKLLVPPLPKFILFSFMLFCSNLNLADPEHGCSPPTPATFFSSSYLLSHTLLLKVRWYPQPCSSSSTCHDSLEAKTIRFCIISPSLLSFTFLVPLLPHWVVSV